MDERIQGWAAALAYLEREICRKSSKVIVVPLAILGGCLLYGPWPFLPLVLLALLPVFLIWRADAQQRSKVMRAERERNKADIVGAIAIALAGALFAGAGQAQAEIKLRDFDSFDPYSLHPSNGTAVENAALLCHAEEFFQDDSDDDICDGFTRRRFFYLAESDGVVTGAALFDDGSQSDVSGTWVRPKLYLTWPPGFKLDGVFEGDTFTGELSAARIDHSCDAVLSRQRQTERQ